MSIALALAAFFLCSGCPDTASSPAVAKPANETLYVDPIRGQDDDDRYDGYARNRAFGTITHAYETALSAASVRTIVITGNVDTARESAARNRIRLDRAATDRAFYTFDQPPASGELTITGDNSRIIMRAPVRDTATEEDPGLRVMTVGALSSPSDAPPAVRVRLENIVITGGNIAADGAGIYVHEGSTVILGRGTVIEKNRVSDGAVYQGNGIYAASHVVRDGLGNEYNVGGGTVIIAANAYLDTSTDPTYPYPNDIVIGDDDRLQISGRLDGRLPAALITINRDTSRYVLAGSLSSVTAAGTTANYGRFTVQVIDIYHRKIAEYGHGTAYPAAIDDRGFLTTAGGTASRFYVDPVNGSPGGWTINQGGVEVWDPLSGTTREHAFKTLEYALGELDDSNIGSDGHTAARTAAIGGEIRRIDILGDISPGETLRIPALGHEIFICGAGENGAAIDADSRRAFIVPAGAKVLLEQITVTGGRAPPSQSGGAFFVENGGTLTLGNGVFITGNRSSISYTGATLDAKGVLGPKTITYGNGVYLDNGGQLNLYGTVRFSAADDVYVGTVSTGGADPLFLVANSPIHLVGPLMDNLTVAVITIPHDPPASPGAVPREHRLQVLSDDLESKADRTGRANYQKFALDVFDPEMIIDDKGYTRPGVTLNPWSIALYPPEELEDGNRWILGVVGQSVDETFRILLKNASYMGPVRDSMPSAELLKWFGPGDGGHPLEYYFETGGSDPLLYLDWAAPVNQDQCLSVRVRGTLKNPLNRLNGRFSVAIPAPFLWVNGEVPVKTKAALERLGLHILDEVGARYDADTIYGAWYQNLKTVNIPAPGDPYPGTGEITIGVTLTGTAATGTTDWEHFVFSPTVDPLADPWSEWQPGAVFDLLPDNPSDPRYDSAALAGVSDLYRVSTWLRNRQVSGGSVTYPGAILPVGLRVRVEALDERNYSITVFGQYGDGESDITPFGRGETGDFYFSVPGELLYYSRAPFVTKIPVSYDLITLTGIVTDPPSVSEGNPGIAGPLDISPAPDIYESTPNSYAHLVVTLSLPDTPGGNSTGSAESFRPAELRRDFGNADPAASALREWFLAQWASGSASAGTSTPTNTMPYGIRARLLEPVTETSLSVEVSWPEYTIEYGALSFSHGPSDPAEVVIHVDPRYLKHATEELLVSFHYDVGGVAFSTITAENGAKKIVSHIDDHVSSSYTPDILTGARGQNNSWPVKIGLKGDYFADPASVDEAALRSWIRAVDDQYTANPVPKGFGLPSTVAVSGKAPVFDDRGTADPADDVVTGFTFTLNAFVPESALDTEGIADTLNRSFWAVEVPKNVLARAWSSPDDPLDSPVISSAQVLPSGYTSPSNPAAEYNILEAHLIFDIADTAARTEFYIDNSGTPAGAADSFRGASDGLKAASDAVITVALGGTAARYPASFIPDAGDPALAAVWTPRPPPDPPPPYLGSNPWIVYPLAAGAYDPLAVASWFDPPLPVFDTDPGFTVDGVHLGDRVMTIRFTDPARYTALSDWLDIPSNRIRVTVPPEYLTHSQVPVISGDTVRFDLLAAPSVTAAALSGFNALVFPPGSPDSGFASGEIAITLGGGETFDTAAVGSIPALDIVSWFPQRNTGALFAPWTPGEHFSAVIAASSGVPRISSTEIIATVYYDTAKTTLSTPLTDILRVTIPPEFLTHCAAGLSTAAQGDLEVLFRPPPTVHLSAAASYDALDPVGMHPLLGTLGEPFSWTVYLILENDEFSPAKIAALTPANVESWFSYNTGASSAAPGTAVSLPPGISVSSFALEDAVGLGEYSRKVLAVTLTTGSAGLTPANVSAFLTAANTHRWIAAVPTSILTYYRGGGSVIRTASPYGGDDWAERLGFDLIEKPVGSFTTQILDPFTLTPIFQYPAVISGVKGSYLKDTLGASGEGRYSRIFDVTVTNDTFALSPEDGVYADSDWHILTDAAAAKWFFNRPLPAGLQASLKITDNNIVPDGQVGARLRITGSRISGADFFGTYDGPSFTTGGSPFSLAVPADALVHSRIPVSTGSLGFDFIAGSPPNPGGTASLDASGVFALASLTDGFKDFYTARGTLTVRLGGGENFLLRLGNNTANPLLAGGADARSWLTSVSDNPDDQSNAFFTGNPFEAAVVDGSVTADSLVLEVRWSGPTALLGTPVNGAFPVRRSVRVQVPPAVLVHAHADSGGLTTPASLYTVRTSPTIAVVPIRPGEPGSTSATGPVLDINANVDGSLKPVPLFAGILGQSLTWHAAIHISGTTFDHTDTINAAVVTSWLAAAGNPLPPSISVRTVTVSPQRIDLELGTSGAVYAGVGDRDYAHQGGTSYLLWRAKASAGIADDSSSLSPSHYAGNAVPTVIGPGIGFDLIDLKAHLSPAIVSGTMGNRGSGAAGDPLITAAVTFSADDFVRPAEGLPWNSAVNGDIPQAVAASWISPSANLPANMMLHSDDVPWTAGNRRITFRFISDSTGFTAADSAETANQRTLLFPKEYFRHAHSAVSSNTLAFNVMDDRTAALAPFGGAANPLPGGVGVLFQNNVENRYTITLSRGMFQGLGDNSSIASWFTPALPAGVTARVIGTPAGTLLFWFAGTPAVTFTGEVGVTIPAANLVSRSASSGPLAADGTLTLSIVNPGALSASLVTSDTGATLAPVKGLAGALGAAFPPETVYLKISGTTFRRPVVTGDISSWIRSADGASAFPLPTDFRVDASAVTPVSGGEVMAIVFSGIPAGADLENLKARLRIPAAALSHGAVISSGFLDARGGNPSTDINPLVFNFRNVGADISSVTEQHYDGAALALSSFTAVSTNVQGKRSLRAIRQSGSHSADIRITLQSGVAAGQAAFKSLASLNLLGGWISLNDGTNLPGAPSAGGSAALPAGMSYTITLNNPQTVTLRVSGIPNTGAVHEDQGLDIRVPAGAVTLAAAAASYDAALPLTPDNSNITYTVDDLPVSFADTQDRSDAVVRGVMNDPIDDVNTQNQRVIFHINRNSAGAYDDAFNTTIVSGRTWVGNGTATPVGTATAVPALGAFQDWCPLVIPSGITVTVFRLDNYRIAFEFTGQAAAVAALGPAPVHIPARALLGRGASTAPASPAGTLSFAIRNPPAAVVKGITKNTNAAGLGAAGYWIEGVQGAPLAGSSYEITVDSLEFRSLGELVGLNIGGNTSDAWVVDASTGKLPAGVEVRPVGVFASSNKGNDTVRLLVTGTVSQNPLSNYSTETAALTRKEFAFRVPPAALRAYSAGIAAVSVTEIAYNADPAAVPPVSVKGTASGAAWWYVEASALIENVGLTAALKAIYADQHAPTGTPHAANYTVTLVGGTDTVNLRDDSYVFPEPDPRLVDTLANRRIFHNLSWVTAVYPVTITINGAAGGTNVSFKGANLSAVGASEESVLVIGNNVTVNLGSRLTFNGDSSVRADADRGLFSVGTDGTLPAGNARGILRIADNGADSAKIRGNRARLGGGVYVSPNGNFIMDGGAVSNNTAVYVAAAPAASGRGGGIYLAEGGAFTMNGGVIGGTTAAAEYAGTGGLGADYGNLAELGGGGLYAFGDTSTVTIHGGTIAGNYAKSGNGGGLLLLNKTTALDSERNPLRVWRNRADYDHARLDSYTGRGGGIYFANALGTLSIGSALIEGNAAWGDDANVGVSVTSRANGRGSAVYLYSVGTLELSGGVEIAADNDLYLACGDTASGGTVNPDTFSRLKVSPVTSTVSAYITPGDFAQMLNEPLFDAATLGSSWGAVIPSRFRLTDSNDYREPGLGGAVKTPYGLYIGSGSDNGKLLARLEWHVAESAAGGTGNKSGEDEQNLAPAINTALYHVSTIFYPTRPSPGTGRWPRSQEVTVLLHGDVRTVSDPNVSPAKRLALIHAVGDVTGSNADAPPVSANSAAQSPAAAGDLPPILVDAFGPPGTTVTIDGTAGGAAPVRAVYLSGPNAQLTIGAGVALLKGRAPDNENGGAVFLTKRQLSGAALRVEAARIEGAVNNGRGGAVFVDVGDHFTLGEKASILGTAAGGTVSGVAAYVGRGAAASSSFIIESGSASPASRVSGDIYLGYYSVLTNGQLNSAVVSLDGEIPAGTGAIVLRSENPGSVLVDGIKNPAIPGAGWLLRDAVVYPITPVSAARAAVFTLYNDAAHQGLELDTVTDTVVTPNRFAGRLKVRTVYHVSGTGANKPASGPEGSDALGNGSEALPLATIDKARAVINAVYPMASPAPSDPWWPGKGTAAEALAEIVVAGTVAPSTNATPATAIPKTLVYRGADIGGVIRNTAANKSVITIDKNVYNIETVIIEGNLLITGGNVTTGGGGVRIDSGELVMNGGAISGNSANQGGGVWINATPGSSTFTFNGGLITGNTVTVGTGRGSGVYVGPTNTSFIMNGGVVGNKNGNTVYVDDTCNDVYLSNATLTAGGTVITIGPNFAQHTDSTAPNYVPRYGAARITVNTYGSGFNADRPIVAVGSADAPGAAANLSAHAAAFAVTPNAAEGGLSFVVSGATGRLIPNHSYPGAYWVANSDLNSAIDDANDGLTFATAFQTLAKAVSAASASTVRNTVLVAGDLLGVVTAPSKANSDLVGNAYFSLAPPPAGRTVTVTPAPGFDGAIVSGTTFIRSSAADDAATTGNRPIRIVGTGGGTIRFAGRNDGGTVQRLEIHSNSTAAAVATGGVVHIDAAVTVVLGANAHLSGVGATRIASNGGGVYMQGTGTTTFIMEEGSSIFNATATNLGGGVYISGNNKTFIMNGGEIYGNSTTANVAGSAGGILLNSADSRVTINAGSVHHNIGHQDGGGISVAVGRFDLNGGAIHDNIVELNHGGGVYLFGAAAYFNMTGGEIYNNRSGNNTASYGGGVYVTTGGGTVTLTGGEIYNNHTRLDDPNTGTGIYFAYNSPTALTIGGAAVVAQGQTVFLSGTAGHIRVPRPGVTLPAAGSVIAVPPLESPLAARISVGNYPGTGGIREVINVVGGTAGDGGAALTALYEKFTAAPDAAVAYEVGQKSTADAAARDIGVIRAAVAPPDAYYVKAYVNGSTAGEGRSYNPGTAAAPLSRFHDAVAKAVKNGVGRIVIVGTINYASETKDDRGTLGSGADGVFHISPDTSGMPNGELVIEGLAGSTPVLDGGWANKRTLYINGNAKIRFKNLTVRNTQTTTAQMPAGGILFIDRSNPGPITEVILDDGAIFDATTLNYGSTGHYPAYGGVVRVGSVNSGGSRCSLVMEHGSVIQGGKAQSGGAIYVTNYNSTGVYTNHVVINGGAIRKNFAATSGGAVKWGDTNGDSNFAIVTMNGGLVEENESAGTSAGYGGGAFHGNGVNRFVLTGGTIRNNKGINGGAVYLYGGTGSILEISGGTIEENTATGNGGGIYLNTNAAARMSGGVIRSNKADRGGGVSLEGIPSSLDMSGGTIIGNTATIGTGVFVSASGTNRASLVMSGDAKIASDNAVYLFAAPAPVPSGTIESYITIGGALSSSAGNPAAYIALSPYPAGTYPAENQSRARVLVAASGSGVDMAAESAKFRVVPVGAVQYSVIPITTGGVTEGFAVKSFDLHVSPSGSDLTGNGTQAAPFQTLGYALDKVKSGLSSTVVVHGVLNESTEKTYASYGAPASRKSVFLVNGGVSVTIRGADNASGLSAALTADDAVMRGSLRGKRVLGIGVAANDSEDLAGGRVTLERLSISGGHGAIGGGGILVRGPNAALTLGDGALVQNNRLAKDNNTKSTTDLMAGYNSGGGILSDRARLVMNQGARVMANWAYSQDTPDASGVIPVGARTPDGTLGIRGGIGGGIAVFGGSFVMQGGVIGGSEGVNLGDGGIGVPGLGVLKDARGGDGNKAAIGGGLYIEKATAYIAGSIQYNGAYGSIGDDVFCVYGGSTYGHFSGGGGLALGAEATVSLFSGTKITGNYTSALGGGALLSRANLGNISPMQGGNLNIHDGVVFNGNIADLGAALFNMTTVTDPDNVNILFLSDHEKNTRGTIRIQSADSVLAPAFYDNAAVSGKYYSPSLDRLDHGDIGAFAGWAEMSGGRVFNNAALGPVAKGGTFAVPKGGVGGISTTYGSFLHTGGTVGWKQNPFTAPSPNRNDTDIDNDPTTDPDPNIGIYVDGRSDTQRYFLGDPAAPSAQVKVYVDPSNAISIASSSTPADAARRTVIVSGTLANHSALGLDGAGNANGGNPFFPESSNYIGKAFNFYGYFAEKPLFTAVIADRNGYAKGAWAVSDTRIADQSSTTAGSYRRFIPFGSRALAPNGSAYVRPTAAGTRHNGYYLRSGGANPDVGVFLGPDSNRVYWRSKATGSGFGPEADAATDSSTEAIERSMVMTKLDGTSRFGWPMPNGVRTVYFVGPHEALTSREDVNGVSPQYQSGQVSNDPELGGSVNHGFTNMVFTFGDSGPFLIVGMQHSGSGDPVILGASSNAVFLGGTTNPSVPPGSVLEFRAETGPNAPASGTFEFRAHASGNRSVISIGGPTSINTATLRFSGVTINGGSGTNGGGINIFGGALELIDSVVKNNTASGKGGGIYVDKGTLELRDSVVTGNSAGYGGGIYTGQTVSEAAVGAYPSGSGAVTARLTLSGTTKVTGNTVTNSGGGVYLDSGNNGGVQNPADGFTGGGAVFTIKDSATVENNRAVQFGGGLFVGGYVKTMDLRAASILGNRVTGTNSNMGGGGMVYHDGGEYTITASIAAAFRDNAAINGGAFRISGSSKVTIEAGAVLEGNGSIPTDGSGNYDPAGTRRYTASGGADTDFTANGGGIALLSNFSGELVLQNGVEIKNNTAVNGGGLYIANYNDSNIFKTGGTVYLYGNSAKNAPDITQAADGNGGAIFLQRDASGGNYTLALPNNLSIGGSNPTTSPNRALRGGGIYWRLNATGVTNVTFGSSLWMERNIAHASAAASNNAPAGDLYGSSTGQGGALYLANSGTGVASFTLNGDAVIRDSLAYAADGVDHTGAGGAVYLGGQSLAQNRLKLTANSPQFFYNEAAYPSTPAAPGANSGIGGVVYAYGATVVMSDWKYNSYYNTAYNNKGNRVYAAMGGILDINDSFGNLAEGDVMLEMHPTDRSRGGHVKVTGALSWTADAAGRAAHVLSPANYYDLARVLVDDAASKAAYTRFSLATGPWQINADGLMIAVESFALTERTTSTLPKVEAGSIFAINGKGFEVTADTTISGTAPATSKVQYVDATLTGTNPNTVTFSFSDTVGTWTDSGAKKGFYKSDTVRTLFAVYHVYNTGVSTTHYYPHKISLTKDPLPTYTRKDYDRSSGYNDGTIAAERTSGGQYNTNGESAWNSGGFAPDTKTGWVVAKVAGASGGYANSSLSGGGVAPQLGGVVTGEVKLSSTTVYFTNKRVNLILGEQGEAGLDSRNDVGILPAIAGGMMGGGGGGAGSDTFVIVHDNNNLGSAYLVGRGGDGATSTNAPFSGAVSSGGGGGGGAGGSAGLQGGSGRQNGANYGPGGGGGGSGNAAGSRNTSTNKTSSAYATGGAGGAGAAGVWAGGGGGGSGGLYLFEQYHLGWANGVDLGYITVQEGWGTFNGGKGGSNYYHLGGAGGAGGTDGTNNHGAMGTGYGGAHGKTRAVGTADFTIGTASTATISASRTNTGQGYGYMVGVWVSY